MTQLRTDKIRLDGGTQMRVGPRNGEALEDYKAAIRSGATLPPVVVFFDGRDHWLADGFHRWSAHRELDLTHIEADVREGTKRDAVLYAVGANASHGLRRSNADKRRAVETLLKDEEWGKWSDREIARRAHVDHKFVGKLRVNLTGDIPSERTFTTRHGTQATMQTTNIGQRPAAPVPDPEPAQAILPPKSAPATPTPEPMPAPEDVEAELISPVQVSAPDGEAERVYKAEDLYIPFYDGSQPPMPDAEKEKRLREIHNAIDRLLKFERGGAGVLAAPDAYTQSVRALAWHARDMLDDWLSEGNERESKTITIDALN